MHYIQALALLPAVFAAPAKVAANADVSSGKQARGLLPILPAVPIVNNLLSDVAGAVPTVSVKLAAGAGILPLPTVSASVLIADNGLDPTIDVAASVGIPAATKPIISLPTVSASIGAGIGITVPDPVTYRKSACTHVVQDLFAAFFLQLAVGLSGITGISNVTSAQVQVGVVGLVDLIPVANTYCVNIPPASGGIGIGVGVGVGLGI